jgi:hypothetical protein
VIIIDESLLAGIGPTRTQSVKIKMGAEETPRFLTVVGVVGRVKMEGLSQDSNRVRATSRFGTSF